MVVVDMEETGNNIRNLMKENNMKPKDVQNVFGFGTVNTVYTWINGKKLPNIDNMVQIASMFNTSLDKIVAVREV